MNLKESKQSKYLVGMYINALAQDNNLAACLHSIANQTHPVDLVIIAENLSSEDVNTIKALADKPFVSFIERDETGKAVEKIIESEKGVNYQILESSDVENPMNFAKIFNAVFNMALENGYEGISLVEPEDGYSVKWFEYANKFSEENPTVGIFAPLAKNMSGGAFSGIMNESPWVDGLNVEEAGKFDLNLLQRFNCLNPLGTVYKIQQILEHSFREGENADGRALPMKESMKLSHYYEFLLRMVYDAVPVMTIPRIGYELKSVRKEAFYDSSCKIPQDLNFLPADRGGLSADEARFWFEIAKKEFFHDEDRKKVYEQSA